MIQRIPFVIVLCFAMLLAGAGTARTQETAPVRPDAPDSTRLLAPAPAAEPQPESVQKNVLTLDQAIKIALEKSYEMKSLRLSLSQAEQNLIAARGRFKTNADLALETPNWNETVSEITIPNALPIFNTTGFTRYMGTLDINQPLPTDGAITLRGQSYHRDVSTYLQESKQDVSRSEIYNSLSLRFSQPLFAINQLKLGLKNANLSYERTVHRYRRSELDIVYRVTRSFFDLYQATRQHEITRDNVQQQQELYDIAAKKYAAGLIPEVEALQMEVDLAESRNALLSAEGELQRSEDTFKQLIGLKLTDQVAVRTDFAVEKIEVDLARATEMAMKYRTELREGQIDIELARISIKEADARSEMRGDINAFYDITGVSDSNLPYHSPWNELWNSSLDDMDRRPHNRGVTFTLSVPLWDWGVNRAEVEAARATYHTSALTLEEQKKTIEREVREVVLRLREAENRIAVLRKNQEVAQRAFDITLERFNNGDITSQELALDRNRLTTAKTSYLSAYVDFKLAVADLQRKTMWDFVQDQSLLDTAPQKGK
ncbi:MAG TPA: TolC family protein [bacterium]|nr:TolC family protein [bacterium]HPR86928.1 TolC family protein [bacterium]